MLTRDEILKLKTLDDDTFVETLFAIFNQFKAENDALRAENSALREELATLKQHVAKLESQVNMTSRNSSKSPSSDGFKKKAKDNSLRVKTDKRTGGQEGHKGTTLSPSDTPDFTIDVKNDMCSHCASDLTNVAVDGILKRQVFDIPMEVELDCTEFLIPAKTCPHCSKKSLGKTPSFANTPVSYGPKISALVTYLSVQNHIPLNRIKQLLKDVFKVSISEGTLSNMILKASKIIEPITTKIAEKILQSEVIHFDETGIYVGKSRDWLHVASNEYLTLYYHHVSRGMKAMLGFNILDKYTGNAIHDGWKAYSTFLACSHFQCNAHILRELKGIKENDKFSFPEKLTELLMEMKKRAEDHFISPISSQISDVLVEKYKTIIEEGLAEEQTKYSIIPREAGKRGKQARSKAYNLLRRISRFQEVLGFFLNPGVIPFDNNLAERDIRMCKVKLKVSGSFRSVEGAKAFLNIRGYLSTLKKNGLNIWEGLCSVFYYDPILPQILEG